MPWYHLAENAKSVTSTFTSLPTLDEIWVSYIELDREGSTLRLRFDVEDFPDCPPAKWAPEFNQVQLTVDFSDVKALCIDGWGRENRAKLTATIEEGRPSIVIQGSECSLRFTCYAFRIMLISGYWDTEK